MSTETEHTMSDKPQLICSICGDPIETVYGWSGGHNAEPINDGRCCSKCNATVVVPERWRRIKARQSK